MELNKEHEHASDWIKANTKPPPLPEPKHDIHPILDKCPFCNTPDKMIYVSDKYNVQKCTSCNTMVSPNG